MSIPGYGHIFPTRPPGFYQGVAFGEKFAKASSDDRAMAMRKVEEVLPILAEAARIIDPNAGIVEGGAMFAIFAKIMSEK